MSFNKINFSKEDGAYLSPLPGEDHISGLIFFGATETPFMEKLYSADDLNENASNDLKEQVQQFFEVNPQGVLFVKAVQKEDASFAGYSFPEVVELQDFAEGKIRQMGVFATAAEVTVAAAAIDSKVEELEIVGRGVSILFAGDYSFDSVENFPDLKGIEAPNVSVVIAALGEGEDEKLCFGATLGMVSKAKVHENIGWVKEFNLGPAYDEPCIANLGSVKNLGDARLQVLDNKGYIFLRKHVGIPGTYFNDSHTAANSDAKPTDYRSIEANRTIHKAIRGVRVSLAPMINGPLTLDSQTGYLSVDTIKYFETMAEKALDQMMKDGELSGYSVAINPEQDVLSGSGLDIELGLVAKGVARTINVKIGFASKTE